MSEERVAVLDHAFVEDLGPTDSCSLSENALGARSTRWGVFSELRPQKFDRVVFLDDACAAVAK